VAAFPVAGPIDVVRNPGAGVLSQDLRSAALAALKLDRNTVRDYALQFSWTAATNQFVANLCRRTTGARVAPDAVSQAAAP
jgi:hypothetical protein